MLSACTAPLAAGVQKARGVSRPQHTERCVPTLLIPEALAVCLGSGQHSLLSAKIIAGGDLLQKCHLSALWREAAGRCC